MCPLWAVAIYKQVKIIWTNNEKNEAAFIDSDLCYRGALYRLICYVEVPLIDSDFLYRGAFKDSDLLYRGTFIDSDLLYRGAFIDSDMLYI